MMVSLHLVIMLCVSLAYLAASAEITKAEEAFFEQFMKEYEANFPKLVNATTKVATRIQKGLDALSFWIPPEWTYRAKTPASVQVKLRSRLKEDDFKSFSDLMRKMHDMVGIRFTVFFPTIEIPAIEAMLRLMKGFEIVNVKRGEGEYLGTNIHARFNGTMDLEVQLRGAYHHAFYQLNHKFVYKPKDHGSPAGKDKQALIKQLRDHAFAAEEIVRELVSTYKIPAPKFKEAGDEDEEDEWGSLLDHFMKLDEARAMNETLVSEVVVN